jgi:outer membrane receptor protein involved in Fe transport
MTKIPSSLTPVALATVALLMQAGSASAQEAAPAKEEPMALDRVVVTGTAQGASKMKQSVSVSTLDAEQIVKQAPTNAAEVLRSVPGVRSESSGGEGNANLTVRGVPISAGGARYVQFQEDGLPILQFGDIAFGTADQFLRVDYNLSHLEVVRGGSASTLASNSPGGLVNFISKTGKAGGGNVGLTLGVDGGRQNRLDFDYGGNLGEKTYFHIGGFNRVGEGDRETGFNAANGGQIKASLTQEFDTGYVRVNLKHLDDRTPSFMPVPTTVSNGRITTLNGIDPRSAWFISPSFSRDVVFNKNGGTTGTNPQDGLHVKSDSIGLESEFKLDGGWKVSEKFRKSSNSGRFIALFPANNGTGTTPATSTAFTATLFNTSIDDLGNTVNDLKVSKSFGDAATGKTTVTGGLFNSVQDVALTWFWNQYTIDMKNSGASATYLGSGFDTWGGCCARTFSVQYTTTAPYAALSWEAGPLSIDGSVRSDEQRAVGYSLEDNATTKTWDEASRKTVDYKVSHVSYSLGGNYQLNKDAALFARVSDGVAFSADRLLYGTALDGSAPININTVTQTEAGVKWRGHGLSLFATLFNAKTKESNYEATTQKFTNNQYSANGLELEAGYRLGAFRLSGGTTYTDAKITSAVDASTVGKRPRRQAKLVYQLAPSYSFGDFEVGAAVIGTTSSYVDDANTITMPGYTVVNAFASWQINDRVQASFSVNNLTNTIGFTEAEGDGHAARSINGRTAKVALKYSF